MLNVLQVSSDSNIGGAGKCILTYLKYRDRDNFNVAVILPKDSLLKPKVEELGAVVYEIDAMAEKSLDRKAIGKLIKIYKEFKPDIVHTHASMAARIAAKLYGAKIVYTRHSVFPQPKKLTHGLGKAICGFVNNHTANRIIAVAEAAKDNVVEIGVDERKIDVILNGVEPLRQYNESERAQLRNEYGVPDGYMCAAIVARLNEVKGHKYLVEAAKILKDKGVPLKTFIAGTGDEAANIQALIKKYGLEKDVIMLGFLDKVEPLMNLMDIQINCSFGTEATSLSLLEGMSIGKPAIVTDFGGNPGVIQSGVNGYLIPTHNPEALAEKLEELLSNTALYTELSNRAKEVFKEKFTAQKYAENIENVYMSTGGKNNGK